MHSIPYGPYESYDTIHLSTENILFSALVLITGMVWALMLYLKYFYRRKKMIEKMDEIRRGPSHTLAMMGLSIIMPFAPGKFSMSHYFWFDQLR